MKKQIDKKSIVIISVLVLVVLISVVTLVILNSNKDVTNTQFNEEENNATNDIVLEDITFSNIKKEYANGITTINATVSNNTNKTKTITIKILLKDNTGNVINEMMQVLEDIEPGIDKVLKTGIVGNYSYISDIEFQVVK